MVVIITSTLLVIGIIVSTVKTKNGEHANGWI